MNHIHFELNISNKIIDPLILPEDAPGSVLGWKDKQGNIAAYTYQTPGYKWIHFPELATYRIKENCNEVLVKPFADQHPEVIEEIFYRNVIPFLLQSEGKETLHASACSTREGIIAFCGDSGTGKSTFAYGFAQRGYPMWSDDMIVFEACLGRIFAIPLRFNVRLLPDAVSYFDHYSKLQSSNDHQSPQIVDASRQNNQPIQAIFILERTRKLNNKTPARVTPLPPGKALHMLLRHAFIFSFGDSDRTQMMIEHYLDLVQKVPILNLEYIAKLERLRLVLDIIQEALNACQV